MYWDLLNGVHIIYMQKKWEIVLVVKKIGVHKDLMRFLRNLCGVIYILEL